MEINIQQIEASLESLPNKIRNQELLCVEAERKLEEAKLEYDVAYGMSMASSKKPNATEKKSEALIESEIQLRNLIEARYNHKIAQAEFNYLTNRFIAVRKIASLEEKMIKSQISGF